MHERQKHALAIIALEKGFNSWSDLKYQLPFIKVALLNGWFANYAPAKAHLDTEGGYLLAYKNQFFICNSDYINSLDFDSENPDWKKI